MAAKAIAVCTCCYQQFELDRKTVHEMNKENLKCAKCANAMTVSDKAVVCKNVGEQMLEYLDKHMDEIKEWAKMDKKNVLAKPCCILDDTPAVPTGTCMPVPGTIDVSFMEKIEVIPESTVKPKVEAKPAVPKLEPCDLTCPNKQLRIISDKTKDIIEKNPKIPSWILLKQIPPCPGPCKVETPCETICNADRLKKECKAQCGLVKVQETTTSRRKPYIPAWIMKGINKLTPSSESSQIPLCSEPGLIHPCLESSQIPPCSEQSQIPPYSGPCQVPPCIRPCQMPPCLRPCQALPCTGNCQVMPCSGTCQVSPCFRPCQVPPCSGYSQGPPCFGSSQTHPFSGSHQVKSKEELPCHKISSKTKPCGQVVPCKSSVVPCVAPCQTKSKEKLPCPSKTKLPPCTGPCPAKSREGLSCPSKAKVPPCPSRTKVPPCTGPCPTKSKEELPCPHKTKVLPCPSPYQVKSKHELPCPSKSKGPPCIGPCPAKSKEELPCKAKILPCSRKTKILLCSGPCQVESTDEFPCLSITTVLPCPAPCQLKSREQVPCPSKAKILPCSGPCQVESKDELPCPSNITCFAPCQIKSIEKLPCPSKTKILPSSSPCQVKSKEKMPCPFSGPCQVKNKEEQPCHKSLSKTKGPPCSEIKSKELPPPCTGPCQEKSKGEMPCEKVQSKTKPCVEKLSNKELLVCPKPCPGEPKEEFPCAKYTTPCAKEPGQRKTQIIRLFVPPCSGPCQIKSNEQMPCQDETNPCATEPTNRRTQIVPLSVPPCSGPCQVKKEAGIHKHKRKSVEKRPSKKKLSKLPCSETYQNEQKEGIVSSKVASEMEPPLKEEAKSPRKKRSSHSTKPGVNELEKKMPCQEVSSKTKPCEKELLKQKKSTASPCSERYVQIKTEENTPCATPCASPCKIEVTPKSKPAVCPSSVPELVTGKGEMPCDKESVKTKPCTPPRSLIESHSYSVPYNEEPCDSCLEEQLKQTSFPFNTNPDDIESSIKRLMEISKESQNDDYYPTELSQKFDSIHAKLEEMLNVADEQPLYTQSFSIPESTARSKTSSKDGVNISRDSTHSNMSYGVKKYIQRKSDHGRSIHKITRIKRTKTADGTVREEKKIIIIRNLRPESVDNISSFTDGREDKSVNVTLSDKSGSYTYTKYMPSGDVTIPCSCIYSQEETRKGNNTANNAGSNGTVHKHAETSTCDCTKKLSAINFEELLGSKGLDSHASWEVKSDTCKSSPQMYDPNIRGCISDYVLTVSLSKLDALGAIDYSGSCTINLPFKSDVFKTARNQMTNHEVDDTKNNKQMCSCSPSDDKSVKPEDKKKHSCIVPQNLKTAFVTTEVIKPSCEALPVQIPTKVGDDNQSETSESIATISKAIKFDITRKAKSESMISVILRDSKSDKTGIVSKMKQSASSNNIKLKQAICKECLKELSGYIKPRTDFKNMSPNCKFCQRKIKEITALNKKKSTPQDSRSSSFRSCTSVSLNSSNHILCIDLAPSRNTIKVKKSSCTPLNEQNTIYEEEDFYTCKHSNKNIRKHSDIVNKNSDIKPISPLKDRLNQRQKSGTNERDTKCASKLGQGLEVDSLLNELYRSISTVPKLEPSSWSVSSSCSNEFDGLSLSGNEQKALQTKGSRCCRMHSIGNSPLDHVMEDSENSIDKYKTYYELRSLLLDENVTTSPEPNDDSSHSSFDRNMQCDGPCQILPSYKDKQLDLDSEEMYGHKHCTFKLERKINSLMNQEKKQDKQNVAKEQTLYRRVRENDSTVFRHIKPEPKENDPITKKLSEVFHKIIKKPVKKSLCPEDIFLLESETSTRTIECIKISSTCDKSTNTSLTHCTKEVTTDNIKRETAECYTQRPCTSRGKDASCNTKSSCKYDVRALSDFPKLVKKTHSVSRLNKMRHLNGSCSYHDMGTSTKDKGLKTCRSFNDVPSSCCFANDYYGCSVKSQVSFCKNLCSWYEY